MTSAARLAALPDLPVLADTVRGSEASYWNGIVAPKGTPANIVAALNSEINAALGSAAMAPLLARLGIAAIPAPPAAFGERVAQETEKWAKVVRFAKITVS